MSYLANRLWSFYTNSITNSWLQLHSYADGTIQVHVFSVAELLFKNGTAVKLSSHSGTEAGTGTIQCYVLVSPGFSQVVFRNVLALIHNL